MAIAFTGIRNVVKYNQDTTPSGQKVGDLWVKPTGFDGLKSWNGLNWILISQPFGGGPGQFYGYNMGGVSGTSYFSAIDRITFPFDSGTASAVGNLTQSKYGVAGCNSSNYGYCMGGYSSNSFSTIDRITFPFDSGTASAVGNLTQSKAGVTGCNSSNYGYNMGGCELVVASYFSTIARITFPFDSGTASAVGNLTQSKNSVAGCNSSNYGYNMGGQSVFSINNFSTIDRITFPFNSGTASAVGNLTQSKVGVTGCNSSNYGYNMGGYSGTSYFLTIDRITFPFDSGTASAVGNLTQSKFTCAGCNSSNYGYCMGGYSSNSFSTIDRITFPFDSGTASAVGNLTQSKNSVAACDGTDFVTLFI